MDKMYVLVLDVETAGDVKTNPLVYDIGAKIVDLTGNVIERGSWIIYDIYSQHDLMASAYYAAKLPQYEYDMANGSRKMARLETIRKIIWKWMFKYNTFLVAAYNTSFDRRALNNTVRTLGMGSYFFPFKTEFIDIWRMACLSICMMKSYHQMAYENGWYSDAGNIRTNAETVYSFLTNSPDFEESHTALEDVDIETEIMLYCWKKVKAQDRGIKGNPWRYPQKEWIFHEAKFDEII